LLCHESPLSLPAQISGAGLWHKRQDKRQTALCRDAHGRGDTPKNKREDLRPPSYLARGVHRAGAVSFRARPKFTGAGHIPYASRYLLSAADRGGQNVCCKSTSEPVGRFQNKSMSEADAA
jgi:hypothetical protein